MKVIDVGCSYGINAALLRTDLDLTICMLPIWIAVDRSRADRETEHRAFFRDRGLRNDIQLVGLDQSFRR
ncbi:MULTISPECIES: hypothetical protein [unclassified Mesorhizobium]|uniref:hypothetical protein n=1 Tax=unclassified Mesorhizobium TaxID=325217 RepID=UPI00163BF3DE|nr:MULTISPECIES: hypothetical protein [unclassified Mesorhizobium]